jgi:arylsulfatase A-like enzyme
MARPNIIFILIDDLGWRDPACYGSGFYETPNVDRLHAEGMHFTDAYAACPVCSPTRASILTGRYPARVGVTNFIDWFGRSHPNRGRLIDAPYVNHLPLEEHNIARALSQAGYQTWHVGKWHLGAEAYFPEQQGFDVNFGGCDYGMPMHGYFSPWKLPGLEDGPEGKYLTDHLTDEAVRLIETADDRPFFLNLWYYSVHIPIQAKEPIIEKYRAKASDLGLDRESPFVEGACFPGEHKKDRRIVRRRFQSDPVYAAMIESMDEGVGRVLDAVEAKGRAENTVVIFSSDNGGVATSEGSPTCNAPLAEGKGWMYEGGTREPLIIKWPGVTAAGSECRTPVTSPDFYPTMLEMAGLGPLEEQHVDGISLGPLLRGTGELERDGLFWHFPHYGNQGGTPGSSIRVGEWKLIEFFEDGNLELYNLREDLGENHNVAPDEHERLRDLHERLLAWRSAVEALEPRPNPDYTPWDRASGSGRHG